MASNINADNGVVSGSAGLKTSADSSGVLALQTNGTTAVTVDTSQNVGIGTTTPSSLVHLQKSVVNNPVDLLIENTAASNFGSASLSFKNDIGYSTGLSLMNSTRVNYGSISANSIGIYTSNAAGMFFMADGTGGNIRFSAGGSGEVARFNVNGLGLGGATPSSGTGITFPATQSASSNANTLDDYEEGTWTPTVLGSISAGTGTYTHQVGTYVKVGQMVCASALITITNHTGSGNLLFGGLPFNTSNTNSLNRIGVTIGGCNNLALNASYVALLKAASNETVIYATQYPVGGGAEIDVALDTSFQIVFTITYRST